MLTYINIISSYKKGVEKMKHTELTNTNHETEVVNYEGLVVIDFWAPWCGPCRAMGKTLEEMSDEDGEGVKLCKVNVDEENELANQYGIRVIPTLVFIKNNVIVFRTEGSKPAEQLKELFEKYR